MQDDSSALQTPTPPTQERVTRNQVIGGTFEDDLSDFHIELSLEKNPNHPFSSGSIQFNVLEEASKVAQTTWNATKETSNALQGIAEIVMGTGEYKVEPAENKPQPKPAEIEAKKNAQEVAFNQSRNQELIQIMSLEEYKQHVKEALMITGREATEEDAIKLGMSRDKKDLARTYALHQVAAKNREVTVQVEEQQEQAETADVKKFKMGENELNQQERAAGGHWTSAAG